MTRLADFQVRTTEGEEVDLAAYDGRVVLVVNTASQCGYAPSSRACSAPRASTPTAASPCSASRRDQFKQEPLADEEMARSASATTG